MIYLRSLRLKHPERIAEGYPFDLPLVRGLGELTFPAPVIFFVGENGTGKSTILEAIAAAAGSIVVGGTDVASDETLAPARRLTTHLTPPGRSAPTAASFSAPRIFSTTPPASAAWPASSTTWPRNSVGTPG